MLLVSKPNIYISRKLPDYLVEAFYDYFNIKMWPKDVEPVPRDVLLEEVQVADRLLSMLSDPINEELFKQAPNLKVVANLPVGYDNINLDDAAKYDVAVANTPDVLTETTADLTFGLIHRV